MKVYRSHDFNTSNPKIWEKKILKLGNGKIFTAKVIITGFDVKFKKSKLGPVTIRQFDKTKDKDLGAWTGRKCVLELKFQDKNHEQESPVSSVTYPYWLIHSMFLALQVYVNSWVGMLHIHYFNEKNEEVSQFGGKFYQVADTRSLLEEPIVGRINWKSILKIIASQYDMLELAIDRYARGVTEIVDESIIDFVIVLENLLGTKLANEISHRVSIRAALLLGKTKEERKNYYIATKYFYDLRSRMVHGDIDEISNPNGNDKRLALQALGADLSTERWWNNRYEISNIIRQIARKILLYFSTHDIIRNSSYFEDLELHAIKP